MLADNCNGNSLTRTCPQQWDMDELEARAGALVNEALAGWSEQVKQVHWQDMKQTAMLAFWEHQDREAAYAYAVAEIALKNYKWVHIRGLNSGWKSLACRDFEVLEAPLETEGDSFEGPLDTVSWRGAKLWEWESVPRPVERQVMWLLDSPRPLTTEEVCRELLIIFAGMSVTNWYPEQMYRGAIVTAMLMTGYTWEDVETQMEMDYREVWDAWWHYRKTRLTPYMALTPIHQELIKLCGCLRLCYFDELTLYSLNQTKRKMVVLPHGIYTITYKRRGCRWGQKLGQVEGSLQKGFSLNGKPMVRAVSLGPVGKITKERLLDSSQKLEKKVAQLSFRQPIQA